MCNIFKKERKLLHEILVFWQQKDETLPYHITNQRANLIKYIEGVISGIEEVIAAYNEISVSAPSVYTQRYVSDMMDKIVRSGRVLDKEIMRLHTNV